MTEPRKLHSPDIAYGEPRREYWCPDCHSFGGWQTDIYYLTADHVTKLGHTTGCTTCNPH